MTNILVLLVIAYCAMGLLFFLSQRKMIYFPTDDISHPYNEIAVSSEGESIRVIVLNKGKTSGLIYFGGNAEWVAGNGDDFIKTFQAHTIYLVNYRGYSGSTGIPREQGLYTDALAVYDRVKKDHNEISVIGRSLGSGVATFLASKRNVQKLVLVTPFDSIQHVSQKRILIYPTSVLLTEKFDSLSRVDKISAKTLIVIAENDSVIPAIHSNILAKAFPKSQVRVRVIEDAEHNTLSDEPSYFEALNTFLNP